MAIGTDVKAPYYILGADGNYHKLLNENIAEQIEGVGRRPATAYEVGDVVASSTNNKVLLLCTTAGTTAETDLNIANKTAGETITDGTVTWKLIQRHTEVLPISGGGTGADNATAARTNLGIDTTYFNPTGTIIAFAGNTLPDGYLLCDGSQVSRTTYKKLFDVIGTTYGEGDGKTTFTLPNLIDRFLEGSSAAGKYYSAGLPNITGYSNWNQNGKDYLFDGAFKSSTYMAGANVSSGSATGVWKLNFDASDSNDIYGSSSTVQPAALNCKFCIKY